MGIFSIGGGPGEPPFNRTFFNVTLGDILKKAGKERDTRLTLFLTDGSTLDVCEIDELSDAYVVLRSYAGGEEACELAVQLIPYPLIYRLQITPRGTDNNRVGFHWTPRARKTQTGRRSPRS